MLKRTSILALGLVIALGSNALAEDKENRQGVDVKKPQSMITASKLLKMKVVNRADESLGSLDQLVLDRNGHIHYAILNRGVLGVKGSVAIPWKLLTVDAGQERLVTAIAKDRFDNAPALKSEDYREFNDNAWVTMFHDYYKADLAGIKDATHRDKDKDKTVASAHGGFVRTKQLFGTDVKGANDKEVAEIEDLIIQDNHHATFVILGHGGFLEIGESHVAVPWKAIMMRQGEDKDELLVSLSMSKEQLEKAPLVKEEGYRELMQPAFAENVHKYFGITVRTEIETEAPRQDKDKPDQNQNQNRDNK